MSNSQYDYWCNTNSDRQSKTCNLAALVISISTVLQLMTQDASHSVIFSHFRFTLHSNWIFPLFTYCR